MSDVNIQDGLKMFVIQRTEQNNAKGTPYETNINGSY